MVLKWEQIFNDFHTHKILSISFCAKIQLRRKQKSFHSSFECYRYSDCSPVKCWKQFHKTKKFHILWTFTSCSMLNKRTGCNFSCFWTGINSFFSSFCGLSCSVQWFFCSLSQHDQYHHSKKNANIVCSCFHKRSHSLQSLFSTGDYKSFCRCQLDFMCRQNHIYLRWALLTNSFISVLPHCQSNQYLCHCIFCVL